MNIPQVQIKNEDVKKIMQSSYIERADIFEVDLNENDTVLLCTDGLSNMVTDERIYEIVTSSVHSEEAARKLVEEANQNGGQDNITALVLKPNYDEVK